VKLFGSSLISSTLSSDKSYSRTCSSSGATSTYSYALLSSPGNTILINFGTNAGTLVSAAEVAIALLSLD
jgi:hypothetical protein